jgi:hypothetical protein
LIDFGQLKEEDEKKYIKQMITDQILKRKTPPRFANEENVQKLLLVIITICQREIRRLENNSAASLRDITRFLAIFEFFESWNELDLPKIIGVSSMVTYLLRIRG